MIRCIPQSLCSWDFHLDDEEHRASLWFNWWSEQGTIIADGTRLEVRKHGLLSGHWTLEHARQELASAQKSSAFTRTFEIRSPMGSLVLSAESAFGRSFRVERSGHLMATVYPDHPLTRRSTIETLTQDFHFPTICFSFWLAVLTWRRAASRSSNG